MSDHSKIQWTEATWNPVTGCTKVSAGCKNCYAKRGWARLAANPKTVYYGREFENVQCHPERLDQPLRWAKPRRIFVNSMSDLFHEQVPDSFLDQVFSTMSQAPQHVFQILTKRPQRMRDYLLQVRRIDPQRFFNNKDPLYGVRKPLPHVWLGVSVEDQHTANERIRLLLETPAAVRFVSAEPLLGEVIIFNQGGPVCTTSATIDVYPGVDASIHWVICGGESGPNARPMRLRWARSLRDQCAEVGVPFFFKQWGEYAPLLVDRESSKAPEEVSTIRVGKKAAGRLLDGVEHSEYPT